MTRSTRKVLIDDPEQPGRLRRRAVVGASYDDLVLDEVVSVNDDANLVTRVKLQCRALTHHNEVSHGACACDSGRWRDRRHAAGASDRALVSDRRRRSLGRAGASWAREQANDVAAPRAPTREGEGQRVRSRRRPAPLTLYFDTSALIKLLVDEDGAEIAVGLWNSRHAVAVGVLAYPEARAALAAARRAGRLTVTGYRTALTDFEALHGGALIVGVDDSLARRAGDLAAQHHLRGSDAVHLASALRLGDQTTLITWDRHMQRAAIAARLAVAPTAG